MGKIASYVILCCFLLHDNTADVLSNIRTHTKIQTDRHQFKWYLVRAIHVYKGRNYLYWQLKPNHT